MVVEDLAPIAVVQELLRQPERPHRRVHVMVAQQPAHGVAEAPRPAVVLRRPHNPGPPAPAPHPPADRLAPPRADDRNPDPRTGEPFPAQTPTPPHRPGPAHPPP